MINSKTSIQDNSYLVRTFFNSVFLLALFIVCGVLSGCSSPQQYIETSLNSRHADYRAVRAEKPLYTAAIKQKPASANKINYQDYARIERTSYRPGGQRNYTVQQGDTLYGISYRFGVSIRKIARVNRLAHAKIKPGQQLFIPSNQHMVRGQRFKDEPMTTASFKTPRHKSIQRRIVVQRGDTLYGLSKRYGVSLGSLMAENNLNTPRVKVGQQLVVPNGQAKFKRTSFNRRTIQEPVETGSLQKRGKGIRNDELFARHIMNNQQRVIVVGSSDTLSGLSHRYKLPVRSIIAANKLGGNKIYYGQKLIIPNSCEPFCS